MAAALPDAVMVTGMPCSGLEVDSEIPTLSASAAGAKVSEAARTEVMRRVRTPPSSAQEIATVSRATRPAGEAR